MSVSKKKVVVGMSGGVDSAVAAFLLKEEGYDVIGATLHLYDSSDKIGNGRTCCSLTDVYDAQKICTKLSIPHYVLNREDEFTNTVVKGFVDGYKAGITPVPCAICNRFIKMNNLLSFAKSVGAESIATGHYGKIVKGLDGNELSIPECKEKDQTYFLYGIEKHVLNALILPIGNFNKEEVRSIADKAGLHVRNKVESQDICFVPNGDYANVVKKWDAKFNAEKDDESHSVYNAGDILHTITGNKLGEHNGLINYTIGQRKGIGVSYHTSLYVSGVDVQKNVLYVCEEEHLYKTDFIIGDCNFLKNIDFDGTKEFDVCVRALQNKIKARITKHQKFSTSGVDNKASKISDFDNKLSSNENNYYLYVELFAKGRAITPGQVCAIYQDDILLGGGIIICVVD